MYSCDDEYSNTLIFTAIAAEDPVWWAAVASEMADELVARDKTSSASAFIRIRSAGVGMVRAARPSSAVALHSGPRSLHDDITLSEEVEQVDGLMREMIGLAATVCNGVGGIAVMAASDLGPTVTASLDVEPVIDVGEHPNP
jgi:hypothetical protein